MSSLKGSLIIAGTGISIAHLTEEARQAIMCAEKVLYAVNDAATERMIHGLNENCESLYFCYDEGKSRIESYNEMIARTIECLREGQQVCVAYYGHAGVCSYPSHNSIKRARAEGFSARMLPGISSLDCMYCDLGIDPAAGCQVYGANDLVLCRRPLDKFSHVIIMQPALIGNMGFRQDGYSKKHIPALIEYLVSVYPPDHEVIFYEAPHYAVYESTIMKLKIRELASCPSNGLATLYIPPVSEPPVYLSSVSKLGLDYTLEDYVLVPVDGPA